LRAAGGRVAGIVGGGLGGQLLSAIGMGGEGLLGSIGAGGVGGALVMIVVSFISKALKKG